MAGPAVPPCLMQYTKTRRQCLKISTPNAAFAATLASVRMERLNRRLSYMRWLYE